MIGHLEIIDIRKQGFKPSIVFVFDCGEPIRKEFYRAEDQLQMGFLPEVHIHPGDDISKLDFRFLTHCIVSITTNERERARLLYHAIKKVVPLAIAISDGTFSHYEAFK